MVRGQRVQVQRRGSVRSESKKVVNGIPAICLNRLAEMDDSTEGHMDD